MRRIAEDLEAISRAALERCSPDRLVRDALDCPEIGDRCFHGMPLIAIGKAAIAMVRGASEWSDPDRTLIIVPEGYDLGDAPAGSQIVRGSHPSMTRKSFEAGERLLEVVAHLREPALVLISGGASACVEQPLAPFFGREDLLEVNERLLSSGLPIEAVNTVRKHLSAIKGGRLGARMHPDSTTLVLSDVSRDRWPAVGSGPTFRDETTHEQAAAILESLQEPHFQRIIATLRSGDVPETKRDLPLEGRYLLADNRRLVEEAADEASRLGYETMVMEEEQNADVSEVADHLAVQAADLRDDMIIIAGGEPTVRVRGTGRGGRCSELAVRFGLTLIDRGSTRVAALFSSSDGVDGNAGASGYLISRNRLQNAIHRRRDLVESLEDSNTGATIELIGKALPARATGNNLRDLFIIARDESD